jgi:hypothetical protein
MKNLLTLVLLAFAFTASAQITFDKDTAKVIEDKSVFQVTAKSLITNNSNDSLFQFERITFNNCDFETAVCDQNLCYPPDTSIQNFKFSSGTNFDMKVNFYPYNNDGHCTVLIYVRSLQNPEIYDSCYYSMQTTDFTSVEQIEKSTEVKLYPNPSSDVVQVETENKQSFDLSIFDILGNEVKTISNTFNNTPISISELPKGIYILKISGEYSGSVLLRKY